MILILYQDGKRHVLEYGLKQAFAVSQRSFRLQPFNRDTRQRCLRLDQVQFLFGWAAYFIVVHRKSTEDFFVLRAYRV